jgi:hypothetical protein
MANHKEVRQFQQFDHEDEDCVRAASAIHQAQCLGRGEALPEQGTRFTLDPKAMHEVLVDVAALVDQYWPAIMRVAKHLERHDSIDQAELDRLIDIAMRNAARR